MWQQVNNTEKGCLQTFICCWWPRGDTDTLKLACKSMRRTPMIPKCQFVSLQTVLCFENSLCTCAHSGSPLKSLTPYILSDTRGIVCKCTIMTSHAPDCLHASSLRASLPFRSGSLRPARRMPLLLACQHTDRSAGTTRRELVAIAGTTAISMTSLAFLQSNDAQAIGYAYTASSMARHAQGI